MKRSFEEANGSGGQNIEVPAKAAAGPTLASTDAQRKCPYLDTINRNVLDFDFEKLCSVSLSNQNVYCCLVCGKYFQGRGKNTHAYTHSVQHSHHVFINLETCRIFCLPDSYEVIDSSLADIKRALDPRFTAEDVANLDHNTTLARDQYGIAYLPGFVGLNNLKSTDFVNVTLHALAHVPPIRDFFLVPSNYANSKSRVVHAFGETLRRIWSPYSFKSAVSPHEFLQAVSVESNKRFRIGVQAECIDFFAWLLNTLHSGLGGTRKPGSSIIHKTFQGLVHVTTLTRRKRPSAAAATAAGGGGGAGEDSDEEEKGGGGGDAAAEGANGSGGGEVEWEETEQDVPFLHLTLDIPPTPLFKDSQGGNVIPQVPLFTVLNKYDGSTVTEVVRSGVHQRKRYSLRRLPEYLIFHLGRFTRNNFYVEKNSTIVNFPIKNLELRDYLQLDGLQPKPEDVPSKTAAALKSLLRERGISTRGIAERAELERQAREALKSGKGKRGTKYDLLANICHDSPPGQGKEGQMDPLQGGSYRVHVMNVASAQQWYEVQDLHVQDVAPLQIGLSESYILIYRLKPPEG